MLTSLSKTLRLRKKLSSHVFAGQRLGSAMHRPLNANSRVVPSNAALELGRPEICGFVKEIRGFAENQEAMRKARRHPDLFVVLRGKYFANPFSKCGG